MCLNWSQLFLTCGCIVLYCVPDVYSAPNDSYAWCSQSTCLMMHKVSIPSSPQHTHTHAAALLASDLPVHTSSLPALQRNMHVKQLLSYPLPLFQFHSWRPWCVISHKLTVPRISYLSRSPSLGWACHDNQYFSEKHAEILFSVFFLSVSLSLKSKRLFFN